MKTKESIIDKPLLTTPQAAKILDLTEYHVREAIRRGQIESVRSGNAILSKGHGSRRWAPPKPMSQRRRSTTPSAVSNILRVLLAAGVHQDRITGVKITDEGCTIFLNQAAPGSTDGIVNELDVELEQFKARHGPS
ncbi:MAG TPA: helix-turn-helix domain-containing protein [Beijerinckiaceae bacterium]|nr:helix-turn-helix domain-containing protein [Beijerinckiaceae bacterium]